MTIQNAKASVAALSRSRWSQLILAGTLLVVAVGLFLWAAQLLPLDDIGYGADWRNVFWGAWQTGHLEYTPGLNNPPWTLWLLWPFAQMPFRTSWALWTLLTVAVLIVSVPARRDGRAHIWLILALLLSFWTLRLLVEGNLAALVIAGALLIMNGSRHHSLWQMIAGIVLVTAKVQESWLLLLALTWELWKLWPPRRWLLVASGVAALILPSLFVSGRDWVASAFGANSSFLLHAVRTSGNASWLGIARWAETPSVLIWLVWLAVLAATVWLWQTSRPTLTREKAGLLIAASMLLSPYTGGASLPVLLALGLIPLWQNHGRLGFGLWLVSCSPYLSVIAASQWGGAWPDWAQLALMLLIWAALGWEIWRTKTHAAIYPEPSGSSVV